MPDEAKPHKPIKDMSAKEFREFSKQLESGKVPDSVKRDFEEFKMQGLVEDSQVELERMTKELTGYTLDELRQMYADEMEDDPEFKAQMQQLANELKQGRTGKAKKRVRSGRFKSAAKAAGKKRGGCKIFALGLLAAGSGLLYGTYEGVSTLASMLF